MRMRIWPFLISRSPKSPHWWRRRAAKVTNGQRPCNGQAHGVTRNVSRRSSPACVGEDGPLKNAKASLSFSPAADLDAERRAARSRIVAILSAETSKLLYRISVLFGRFDRPLALSVGAIDPAVPEPGTHLDTLIGPWVELTAQRDMRVSPLLENAGAEILTPDETKRVHEAAAQHILGGRSLSIDKANCWLLACPLGRAGMAADAACA